jgi:O-antigen biosynthesis protein
MDNIKNYPKTMEFTGERYVSGEHGNIELEHVHRYVLARSIVKNKVVLDIASGEGYGSSLLSQEAQKVIGIDISQSAVAYAKIKYNNDNLEFLVGSCANIPLASGSIDIVVSFETIEHHDAHHAMLKEIKRVLRPNGTIIISTPDKYEYSDVHNYRNYYHVKEFYREDFKEFIGTYFKYHSVYGQRVLYGSAIFCEDRINSIECYELGVNNFSGTQGVPHAIYLITIASDVKLPHLSHGLLIQPLEEAELVQDIKQNLSQNEIQINKLHKEVHDRENQINSLLNSYSWKITVPLRAIRNFLHSPRKQLENYSDTLLSQALILYQKLPIRPPHRMAIRCFLEKFIPKTIFRIHNKLSFGVNVSNISDSLGRTHQQNLIDKLVISDKFAIPSSEDPIVSVIIPIYGKFDYTLRCLASIAINLPQVEFEVIIVDDCSPDHSRDFLSKVYGIHVVRNKNNQGFINSCNIGARVAKGRYLYFLNNDTEVFPGWMDELLRTFENFPGTGLAGSKLLFPDGRLQEAGCVVWNDGSAWNFGRFQDKNNPIFNYAREVDYCSGASIMIPKQLFDELNGFDIHYYPAYYEDSDIAFRVRAKGFRVIYQPMSEVVHYEGVTSGKDIFQGVKAHQATNSKKFIARWENVLKDHQLNGINIDRAKDCASKYRALILDHCTPTPDMDSGSIDTLNTMLLLRELNFQVTFIPEDNFLYIKKYTSDLQRNGIEVLYAPYVNSIKQHLHKFGDRYDVVFLFRAGVAKKHIKLVRECCKKAKIIFVTVDLHFVRLSREAILNADQSQRTYAEQVKKLEYSLIKEADISTVISSMEYKLLSQDFEPEKVYHLPYARLVRQTSAPFLARKGLVFVGSYQHPPNIDAVIFFIKEVLPLVQVKIPDITLYLVGNNPPQQISSLSSKSIIVLGYVEDLWSLFNQIRLSIAPLRYGAGIKGKVGTSLAFGVPTVCTSIAAEGMSVTDNENILIADDAESFSAAIIELYNNQKLWENMRNNGLLFAESSWGAEPTIKKISDIFSKLGLNCSRRSYALSLYTG